MHLITCFLTSGQSCCTDADGTGGIPCVGFKAGVEGDRKCRPTKTYDTAMYAPAEQVWPLEQQLAVYTKAAQEIADPALGVELMLNWPAMSNENCIVGMYNDTNQANSGMPTPFYAVAREINKKSRLSEKAMNIPEM